MAISETGALQSGDVSHSFSVRVLGCVICFEAESNQARELLDRHLFPSVRRESAHPEQSDIKIRIAGSEREVRLIVNGVAIASADRPTALLRQLIDWLDRTLVQRLTGLHAIHAGAVLIGDKALVLPGASHSGKSSLVAELLRRGAVCLSDEYALIDAEGLVHAYPRALLLRMALPLRSQSLPGNSMQRSPRRRHPSDGSWPCNLTLLHPGRSGPNPKALLC